MVASQSSLVFLLGAGAALSWDAPCTRELTDLVLKGGFKIEGEEITVTRKIYDLFIKNGYQESDITFETIISAIEELIVYFSGYDSSRNIPSLPSCFFEPSFNRELFNYSIKEGSKPNHLQLQIPKGVDYNYGQVHTYDCNPDQLYLMYLMGEILTDICGRVAQYAYPSVNSVQLARIGELDCRFIEWMKSLSTHTIRLYTLNYDKIFKVLMEQADILTFEGFEFTPKAAYKTSFPAIPRILSDITSNIHYNLHGSVLWEILERDEHQFDNPRVRYSNYISLPMNSLPSPMQMEKGRTMLLSNIVTGYQKAQKGMLTPYKQMQASFDRDCIFCERLYIIGYSFGDEHINESIKTSLRYNEGIQIIVIDPSFTNHKIREQFILKYFTFLPAQSPSIVEANDKFFWCCNGAFQLHAMTFDEFLFAEKNIRDKN